MMDIKDAHKVIENLQTRPFICSENTMELDNGYVIVKKEHFERLAEEQPKIGEWIPCSERFPENSKTDLYDMQLVTLDNGDVCLGVYRHDDKEWLTRMSEGENKYSNKHKVIAWQPLPEAYHEPLD